MSLVSCEYKEFQFGGRSVILDVERNMLYQLDKVSLSVLHALPRNHDTDPWAMAELEKHYSSKEIHEALSELKEQELIHDSKAESLALEPPQLPDVETLCIYLTYNCNLRCNYCYARTGEYGVGNEPMSFSTVMKAVEFLLERAPPEKKAHISFFGGEPLLHWDILQRIIPYIRQREDEEKRNIGLSMPTNGTLLTDDIIRFLDQAHVQVTVSLDGPPHIHDRMRVFPNNSGSYIHIIPNIRKLLQIQKRCSIRVTLDPNRAELTEVVEHLFQIGATQVHLETASDVMSGEGRLYPSTIENLRGEYRTLKDSYIQTIETESKLLPITPFVPLLRMLKGTGQHKHYGCGAGRSYLAISPSGEFYPCHRFIGHKEFLLGDLYNGLCMDARRPFMELHVHYRDACQDCWARYLCGGACYYDAAVTQGSIEVPDPIHCELNKEIITEAVEIATYLSRIPPHELWEMAKRQQEAVSYLWNT